MLSNEDTLIERFLPRPRVLFQKTKYVTSGCMVRDIAPGGCTLRGNLHFGVSGTRCDSVLYCGNSNWS